MSAAPKFAILRTQKIKDFPAMARRCRHCERSGKTLPANADQARQHLNTRIFPKAYGPEKALLRWRERLGKQRVRRNGVLAVEIFMGMSPGADADMSPEKLKAWYQDSIAWAELHFGGKANIIAGATNGDETTPHVHLIAIPIDARGRLNCRKFLGGGGRLRQLQSSYALAVKKHGLERGVEGSKRKYIPQKTLNEWRNQVDRDFKKAVNRLDEVRDDLETMSAVKWTTSKKKIIDELNQVLDQTKNELTYAFGMAQEVILARRDMAEHNRLIREKSEALTDAVKTVKEAQVVKLRADEVLKQNAALVRGLDLVPIASEILALTPVEKGGIFTFTDANIDLRIEGRNFRDAKNSKCTGSGAIDLVMKLGERDFKQAVEFLLTKNTADNLVADAVSVVHKQEHEKITALKPKPRILTLDDVPSQIWKPVSGAWAKVRQLLIGERKLDATMIDRLHGDDMLWAVADDTVAFARTGPDMKTKVGVTLLNLKSANSETRILAPDQQGFFWLGGFEKNAKRIVAVANPLEALSYREILAIQNPEKESVQAGGIVATTHIVSVDAFLPPEHLVLRINPATQKFFLATNSPDAKAKLAEKFPLLLIDEELPDWMKTDGMRFNNPRQRRTDAWNTALAKIKATNPQIAASLAQANVINVQREIVKARCR